MVEEYDGLNGPSESDETRPLSGDSAPEPAQRPDVGPPPDGAAVEGERGSPDNGDGDEADSTGVDKTIVEAFESELAEAMRKADENWDRYLRAEAELENLRKRSERRRDEALQLQRREMLSACLEVMDNLERALTHGADDPAAVVEGVETTYRELARSLSRQGVEQMQALDEPFDPELHEAVGVVPLPPGKAEVIVVVDRPGYTLDGNLLRPARVLVGKPQDGEEDGETP
jgi:molecular chaperone GrpE